ncbi:MFS transporter [Marinimicrobium sp. ABcell2]|uniref:MFS transporter n=1 Tax=Marinimicrobium sp. ABcell2 TaxID=3069751 RepID=UPI0027B4AE32|nr:MFS transporter [Marinimicrobium sp. ABcell2]MDQ2075522.1 MFS transporter [Marinimicrobium sp. ABcell2]
MVARRDLPYWRLSGFYAFYFAVLGALIPYWGLYLKSLGYSSPQIGLIAAIIMGTKVVAPLFWGWLAEHSGQRLGVIRLGSFLACLTFLGIFFYRSEFAWLALVVACYTFFWNAVLPQFEVVTLDYLDQHYDRYSQIRLWGSVGFILAVVGLGWVFDVVDIYHLPVFILSFLIMILLASLSLPAGAQQSSDEVTHSLRHLLSQPASLSFFAVCFLLQLSHGPYYTFYSLYLVEQYGYTRSATGLLWALGVVAEVGIFLVMHKLVRRWGVRYLLLVSLLLTAVRWVMIGFGAGSLGVLLLAQLLHAFSFAVAHAMAIEWVRRQFPGRQQGHGQALYSALSFGAGGALGAMLSGLVWDFSPQWTFAAAAVAALLAYAIGWWGIRDDNPGASKL